MDVPIMLSPVDCEPRVMGPLLEETETVTGDVGAKERNANALSRWLGRPRTVRKSSVPPREGFWGGRLSRLAGWKAGGVVMVR